MVITFRLKVIDTNGYNFGRPSKETSPNLGEVSNSRETAKLAAAGTGYSGSKVITAVGNNLSTVEVLPLLTILFGFRCVAQSIANGGYTFRLKVIVNNGNNFRFAVAVVGLRDRGDSTEPDCCRRRDSQRDSQWPHFGPVLPLLAVA
jgi:hypothetical protein